MSVIAAWVAFSINCIGSMASETETDLFFMSPTPITMGVFLDEPIFASKIYLKIEMRQGIQNKNIKTWKRDKYKESEMLESHVEEISD